MRCAESLRVQAYFDGEIDAIAAADMEHHLELCAECRALLEDLGQVRVVLRRDFRIVRAPPALRAEVAYALDRENAAETRASAEGTPAAKGIPRPTERGSAYRRLPSFWVGALGGAGATAIAATFAFLLLVPRPSSPLFEELVSAHVRSLMPAHLIDVVSTDKHTVKPWFAGHADVSPAVADFEAQGYRLMGGRADYLDHQRSAVVVYQHGSHIINVFSWAGNERALPNNATRSGYHLAFWKAGDLEYCAVSDTAWDELDGLVRLLRDQSARDGGDGAPK